MARAKPGPSINTTVDDDPRIVVLAAKISEQAEDLAQMRADVDEIKRALGLRGRHVPRSWIGLKEAANRCGVSPETVRLWALRNLISADRYKNEWRIDPESLERRARK